MEKTLRKPGARSSCWRNSKIGLRRSSRSTSWPLEAALQAFVAAEGVKIGELIHPLRVAVTGKSVGPGLYDCLAILGRAAMHRPHRASGESSRHTPCAVAFAAVIAAGVVGRTRVVLGAEILRRSAVKNTGMLLGCG